MPRDSRSRAASDSGIDAQIDHSRDTGHAAELGEIAGEPIGHVHRRTGMIADDFRERDARLRHAIAPDQQIARGRIADAAWTFPPPSTASPSAASPIVPVTSTRSPGLAPLR